MDIKDVPDDFDEFFAALADKRTISLGMGDFCFSMASDELPSEKVDVADQILSELCGDGINQLDLDGLSRVENEPRARITSDVANVTERPTMIDFENWQPINCTEGVEQLNSCLAQANNRDKFIKVLRKIVKEPIANQRKHPVMRMMLSIIHPRQMKAYAYSRTFTGKLPFNQYEALLDACEEVLRENDPDYDHAQFHYDLKYKLLKNASNRYK